MKIIGIDFDNTLVSYDEVFHRHGCELGLIAQTVEKNKTAVRSAIRSLPQGNDKWTELQGRVYGEWMPEARVMPGAEEFLAACRAKAYKIYIISHKTRYPFLGPQVDLQFAAKSWIRQQNLLERFQITEQDIVFEETLRGKIRQIRQRQCEYFIDDLLEVLTQDDFPGGVKKILLNSEVSIDVPNNVMACKDWNEIKKYLAD